MFASLAYAGQAIIAKVSVCFTSVEQCESEIIDVIDRDRSSIRVQAVLGHREDLGIRKVDHRSRRFLLIPSGLYGCLHYLLQSDVHSLLAFQVPVRIIRRQGWWRDVSISTA